MPKLYTVVCRSRASAIISPGESLTVTYQAPNISPIRINFRTRYADLGFEIPVPTDLIVEARHTETDMKAAIERSANVARELGAVLAVATNASMGNIQIDLAYDASPGVREREFFQTYLPEEPLTIVPARAMNIASSLAFISALGQHKRSDRLMRAVAQYSHTLDHWSPGDETLCLAHLFMGMEALKPIALTHHSETTDMTPDQLGAEWGFKDGGGSRPLVDFLQAEVRKRLLFRGDEECHRKAKRASDDFEHGFENFGAIRQTANSVVVRTASYLRQAILDLSRLDHEHRQVFLSDPFTTPRGPLKIVKYLRGRLVSEGDTLAATGEDHPRFRWASRIDKVYLNDAGKYSFSPSETVTAVFSVNTHFRPESVEVWDGSTLHDVPPPPLS